MKDMQIAENLYGIQWGTQVNWYEHFIAFLELLSNFLGQNNGATDPGQLVPVNDLPMSEFSQNCSFPRNFL